MEGKDELLTIAEIAVGIAGFSGVIAVFMEHGNLSLADRLRFLAVFATAFSALLLSFVPIALQYLDLSAQAVWRSSSLIMAAWSVLGLVPYPRGLRRVREELGTSQLAPIALFGVPAAMNFGLQLLNASSWLWEPGVVPYLLGMLVYLYTAGLFFVLLVLFRPHS